MLMKLNYVPIQYCDKCRQQLAWFKLPNKCTECFEPCTNIALKFIQMNWFTMLFVKESIACAQYHLTIESKLNLDLVWDYAADEVRIINNISTKWNKHQKKKNNIKLTHTIFSSSLYCFRFAIVFSTHFHAKSIASIVSIPFIAIHCQSLAS